MDINTLPFFWAKIFLIDLHFILRIRLNELLKIHNLPSQKQKNQFVFRGMIVKTRFRPVLDPGMEGDMGLKLV